MRWIRYSTERKTSYGILTPDKLILEVSGNPFDGYRETGHKLALGQVKVELPVIPSTFHALGRNYAIHAREYATGNEGIHSDIPKVPQFGLRASSSLVAHSAAVIAPADGLDDLHYEGELVVVIGKKAKNLQPETVADAILGYTIGNDISQRAWQKGDGTTWRAKNTDTFSPMGPWIETDLDLDALQTTVRVNGEIKTRFKTDDMLFGVEECLCLLTRYVTLFPGDVLWMGTEGSSPKLQQGDIVDVEISGIGTLSNRITADHAA